VLGPQYRGDTLEIERRHGVVRYDYHTLTVNVWQEEFGVVKQATADVDRVTPLLKVDGEGFHDR